jgi:hypothetical protein
MRQCIVSCLSSPRRFKVWGGHGFWHTNEKGDPKAAFDFSVTNSSDEDLAGATRRDRTGDLLITNQPLYQLS